MNSNRVLTLRELNRATLARQMLLNRETLPAPTAIERLVGMQAQMALPPFVGLWTRLTDFQREYLAAPIEQHSVVKATLMRATLHLFTAGDYVRFRSTLQPALSGASEAIVSKRGAIDTAAILDAAREFISEQPRTFAEISDMLSARWPDTDVGSMRYTVRTHIALVQVPMSSGWSYSSKPAFTLAESWLGQSVSSAIHFKELVFRYLAAFGPASVTDLQTWSGLPKLKEAVEALKPDLVVYPDDGRRELFDMPDAVIPAADTPAPPRFLPEFDNLLLSHSKRTRVIADEHRSKVYLPGLRVAATILIDGFVAGVWKATTAKKVATLTIEPFAPLPKVERQALIEEGERLVRFIEAEAKSYVVRLLD
ncbi:MAG: winged helix DNA-binding domain-containing protein [Anaerolineae bacterium]